MRTIHKYQLEIVDTSIIDMPKSAMILTVQEQKGIPYLWCLVNTEMEIGKRIIKTISTGQSVGNFCLGKYIGSCQLYNGEFVLHVFDQGYEK